MSEKLIELIKNKNDEGLKLLKQQHSGLIYYIVSNILHGHEDVEECISDIMMKVWESIETYSSDKGRFTTWLTAISRNTALNYLRRRNDLHEELKEDIADTSSPETLLLQQEKSKELKDAIERLTHHEQHIFYRKYYYMQQTTQIAAELGASERSIEGKLYRLRKKLQKELGGDFR